MDKGLFFLIVSIGALWLILDDFFGNRFISQFSQRIAPNVELPTVGDIAEGVKDKVEETHDKILDDYQEGKEKKEEETGNKDYFKELQKKLDQQTRPS